MAAMPCSSLRGCQGRCPAASHGPRRWTWSMWPASHEPKMPKATKNNQDDEVEKTKYLPKADFDNLINGMHAPKQQLLSKKGCVDQYPGHGTVFRPSKRHRRPFSAQEMQVWGPNGLSTRGQCWSGESRRDFAQLPDEEGCSARGGDADCEAVTSFVIFFPPA